MSDRSDDPDDTALDDLDTGVDPEVQPAPCADPADGRATLDR